MPYEITQCTGLWPVTNYLSVCLSVFSSRRHHRRRQSVSTSRRREPSTTSQDVAITSPAFIVGSPAVILQPPPSYMELEATSNTDSRPPAYFQCLSHEMRDDGGVQLCTVDDLPTPLTLVEPTAPPTPNNHLNTDILATSLNTNSLSNDEHQKRVDYRNPAFSDSGV